LPATEKRRAAHVRRGCVFATASGTPAPGLDCLIENHLWSSPLHGEGVCVTTVQIYLHMVLTPRKEDKQRSPCYCAVVGIGYYPTPASQYGRGLNLARKREGREVAIVGWAEGMELKLIPAKKRDLAFCAIVILEYTHMIQACVTSV
jgi:hypothetical protein